jgi:hypothetical protein
MKTISIKRLHVTLSMTTFSITTLSIKGLHVTFSISDIQHNNNLPLCRVLLGEGSVIFMIMLSVVMLNVVMLSVIMPMSPSIIRTLDLVITSQ